MLNHVENNIFKIVWLKRFIEEAEYRAVVYKNRVYLIICPFIYVLF